MIFSLGDIYFNKYLFIYLLIYKTKWPKFKKSVSFPKQITPWLSAVCTLLSLLKMRLQFWIKTTIGFIFCTPSPKTLSIVKILPPWLVKIHPLARCRWAVNCSLGCPMHLARGITGWERPYWCAVCWGAHGRKTCPLYEIRPSDLLLWSGSM